MAGHGGAAARAAAALALLCGAALAGCAPIERAFDLAPPNVPKKTVKRTSPLAQAQASLNADSIDLYQGPTSAPQGGPQTGARGQVPPPTLAQGLVPPARNGPTAPRPLYGGGGQAPAQPVRVADARPPARQPAYRPTPLPPSQALGQQQNQPGLRPAQPTVPQNPYQATRAAQERRIAEYEARQRKLRAQGAPAPLSPGAPGQPQAGAQPQSGSPEPKQPVRVASANEQVPYPAPPRRPVYTGSTPQGPAGSDGQVGGGPRSLSPPGDPGGRPAPPLDANDRSPAAPGGGTVPAPPRQAEPDPEDLPDNSAVNARSTIWDWAKVDKGRHTREKTPVERLRESREILARRPMSAYGASGAFDANLMSGGTGEAARVPGPVPRSVEEPAMLGLRGAQDGAGANAAPAPAPGASAAAGPVRKASVEAGPAPQLDAGAGAATMAGASPGAALSRVQPMRIYFQPGAAFLSSQTIASIVSVARAQKARGGRVHVVGLATAAGGQGTPGQLAQARADAVAQELALQGVTRKSIVAAAGQAQGDRVEVFIE